jgi:hypothetical protein
MAHYGDPYKGLMAFSEELCSALRESRPFNLPTGAVLVLEEEDSSADEDSEVDESIADDASESIDIEDSEIEDIDSINAEDSEADELIGNGASEDINNLEELEFEDP